MLVKSTVLVTLDLTADARQLKDGTIVLTDMKVTRAEMPMSAYRDLPPDVRTHAEEQLAQDARKFLDDMKNGPLAAQVLSVVK